MPSGKTEGVNIPDRGSASPEYATRTTMKLLHMEDGGLELYMKRLEEGTFRLPPYDEKSRSYPMEWRDLVMMVEGIRNDPSTRLKRLKAMRRHP